MDQVTRRSHALNLIEALISSSFDKDANTKQAICDSITFFGRKQPELVLNAVQCFVTSHAKIDQMHRLLLFNCMKDIVDQCEEIDVEVAKKVIALAAEDLTIAKKPNKDCQNAASNLLASLGKWQLIEVIDELLKKFVPGILAHNFVIQTLGKLALSNVSGMMNHMNYVLATAVSQIGLAKQDNVRKVFAISLGNFSDCICELYSTTDLSKDLPKGAFARQFSTAYDVLFNGWLQSKSLKVQCAVIQALGKISLLLPLNELEETAPKLITTLIGLYRRHPNDALVITTALCDVITALTSKESRFSGATLEAITTNLHFQVCNMPAEATPLVTKNYNEVLRCFGILAGCFSSSLVTMLLQRLDARDDRIRTGSILILKHLINSNPVPMKDNQDLIISGLQKCLFDPSNRLKYNLAKLVIAMGTHGLLHREGGQEYVKFIIRQCTLPSYDIPTKVPPSITNEQLRDMCADILHLLTTTVEDADKVLWPYLFEFLTDRNFTLALGVIVRSLSILAHNKKSLEKEEDDKDATLIDFQNVANVPQATGIFSRLFVMLADPKRKLMHSDAFLSLLQDLSSSFHEKLGNLFEEKIPLLLVFFKEHDSSDSTWPQEEWEDVLLKLLASILDEIADEEWACSLGQSITSQWPLYEFLPEHKSFAFKCLGVVLQKINNREFVVSYLALLFMSVNHSIPVERQGASMCVGRCAFIHLDAVLEKLDEFVTNNITKKESSYLNIFKSEKSLNEMQHYKGTAALCCGYIALYAPPDLILSRMEMNIIKTITGLSKNIKATNIRIELVRAVHLIAMSLDPERFSNLPNQPRYVFAAREDLINKLLNYFKDDQAGKATKLKASILIACAALVKLEPPMSGEDVDSTIKRLLSSMIPLHKTPDDEKELTLTCTDNLNKVLEEMLKKRPNSNGLLVIFRHFESYLISSVEYERLAAIQLTRTLLERFHDIAPTEGANVLGNTGLLIARVLPCCSDSLPTVRLEALLCIRQLLNILDQQHEYSDQQSLLDSVADKLLSTNNKDIYDAIVELSKTLCGKLPSDLLLFQHGSLTACLFDALAWPQSSSVHGPSAVLSYIIESRGSLFANQVKDIVSTLVGKLVQVFQDDRPQNLKDSILYLLCLLSHHHLQPTVNALLDYPLPYSNVVIACWHRLGIDKSSESLFDSLLEQLDRSLPYEELLKKKGKPKHGSAKTAAIPSLAISSALHHVINSLSANRSDVNQTLYKYRHRLISTSLVRVGTMYDVLTPPKLKLDPYKQALELFHTVIHALCDVKLTFDLEQAGVWTALEAKDGLANLSFVVGCVTKVLSTHQANDLSHIVTFFNNYLPSIYDLQRLTAVAFFVHLVQECSSHNEVLLEIAMNNLRSRLVDSHNYVRQLCLVGLSNIVYAPQNQIDRYSTSVLSAMMAGMDDNDDHDHSISLAAMSGLALFLNRADKVNIHSMFVNICLRARPCFEKEDARVRSAAFQLFGALAKYATDELEVAFNEQAHSNFISMLMHLNDEDEQVKKSCKVTLKEVGRHIGSDKIGETFQKYLLEDCQLHYGEFMNNLSKLLVSEFPEKVNFYAMECVSFFKSSWPVMRSNAAMVAGFLLSSLDEEHRGNINSEHVCAGFGGFESIGTSWIFMTLQDEITPLQHQAIVVTFFIGRLQQCDAQSGYRTTDSFVQQALALIQLLKDSTPMVRSKAAESISLLYLY